jgi:hypothetical protein
VEAYPVTTGRHKCKTTFSASVDTVCHKVASVRQPSHAGFVLVSLRKGRGKPGRTQRIKILTVLARARVCVCVCVWHLGGSRRHAAGETLQRKRTFSRLLQVLKRRQSRWLQIS